MSTNFYLIIRNDMEDHIGVRTITGLFVWDMHPAQYREWVKEWSDSQHMIDCFHCKQSWLIHEIIKDEYGRTITPDQFQKDVLAELEEDTERIGQGAS